MLNYKKKSAIAEPKGAVGTQRKRGLLRRFLGEKSGATAIEFAILALPFFVVIFASLETFAAFTGEQLLNNATDTLARKVRTGEITFGLGRTTDMTEAQFRQAFCDEISVMMTCSASEVKTPSRLYIDVRSFADFSKIPISIPRTSTTDLDTSSFKFAPGGPTTINTVRAYYRWSVTADLVRPYITGLRPAGAGMPNDYLMVATTAFINENF